MGAGSLLTGCLLSIDESLLDRDAAVDATTLDVVNAEGGGAVDAADAIRGADGAGGGGDAQESGSVTDADASLPEAGCPAGMVQVPAPGGGKPYCVDSTEVTNKAYGAFLAVAEPPDASSQIAECAWNTSFEAGTLGADNLPIGSINWCDAYAYCAWAGKRLCGAVGGGSYPFANGYPSLASQWYAACSRGGAQVYPYGNTYQRTTCNGRPLDAGTMLPVGSLPGCEGGYPGIFDMSGNVSEFIDSCDTTPQSGCGSTGPECDLCLLVGGGFLSGGADGSNIACTYPNEVYRNSHYVDNGFRCCADLP
jgi:formylglycine-generating enzyme required for sulfatase activity